ncbi:MAG: M23 family metallopeptidase [Oscillospiraceae bacterium]|nr:M23 family metallopeptidase [Oscillospiraceae bacterium]
MRYGAYRRPQRTHREQSNWRQTRRALRLAVCLAMLGLVLLLRACFPATVEAMRETVLPVMEENIDYRGAIAAIGEGLAGELSIMEVLGDLTVRAFGGVPAEDVEVTGQTEEPQPLPFPPPTVVNPPIAEVIPMPEALPGDLARPLTEPDELEEADEPAEPEAVAVFLARQEEFTGHVMPASVVYTYVPLGMDFVSPTTGRVSSPFGFRRHPIRGEVLFHFGTDVAADTGTPIVAVADGTVLAARECAAWGLYILLDHGGGIVTRYAHASVLYVRAGDVVERGQRIARVGQTGAVTGPHLHFEITLDGMHKNPEFYIEFMA